VLPGQLDLFGDTVTAPSSGLAGVRLRFSSPCRDCGCGVVVINSSKGPHSAAIRCEGCNCHRGWLSRGEVERIAAIVGESGRPTEPIEIGGGR
jgi:hypothetical protein